MSAVITFDSLRSQLDSRAVALARWLIAALFVVSGIAKALSFDAVAGWMSSEGVPAANAVLLATLALEIVDGLLLGAGVLVRAIAITFIVFVIAATLQFHAFRAAAPELVQDQLTHFLKNAAIVAALLLLAMTSPETMRARLARLMRRLRAAVKANSLV